MKKNKMKKNKWLSEYSIYYQGPHLSATDNDEIAAMYEAAVSRGERKIALVWSWCGGSECSHAVDGRGRHWSPRDVIEYGYNTIR